MGSQTRTFSREGYRTEIFTVKFGKNNFKNGSLVDKVFGNVDSWGIYFSGWTFHHTAQESSWYPHIRSEEKSNSGHIHSALLWCWGAAGHRYASHPAGGQRGHCGDPGVHGD